MRARRWTSHRGREIDTAGDGFLAVFDGPARAVRCAQEIAARVRELDLEIRAGLHSGEVELDASAVHGIAVHIGARVAALAGPSEVLVSSTVRDLTVGSGIVYEDRGEHELKGVPDRWRLFAVVDAERPSLMAHAKNLGQPDETIELRASREDAVEIGDFTVARVVSQPGWRWSTAHEAGRRHASGARRATSAGSSPVGRASSCATARPSRSRQTTSSISRPATTATRSATSRRSRSSGRASGPGRVPSAPAAIGSW